MWCISYPVVGTGTNFGLCDQLPQAIQQDDLCVCCSTEEEEEDIIKQARVTS